MEYDKIASVVNVLGLGIMACGLIILGVGQKRYEVNPPDATKIIALGGIVLGVGGLFASKP